MTESEFARRFRELTGHAPLSWQWRLFCNHFANGKFCNVIDLPTGLGKTMVMAIWLIAREVNKQLPRRLIYVVDRRTVVDQATDLAERLAKKWNDNIPNGDQSLAISTLRGQLADNREWSRDPTRLAIIIGTVDLIGSALLFSGYRSTYKRRPLEAGLLGQDSLLVLDEAHLSTPFEKLLRSIGEFNKACPADTSPVEPMHVIRMSATSSIDSPNGVFQLQGNFDARTGDFADDTIRNRFNGKKQLTVKTLGQKARLADTLADEAIKLANDGSLCGKRIGVFVRRPEDAKTVATIIRAHVVESLDESGPKPRKIKQTPHVDSVETLTGTMRGRERDLLVEKPVFKDRWLNGNLNPDKEHEDYPEWAGPFDPDHFDASVATKAMRKGLPDWRASKP